MSETPYAPIDPSEVVLTNPYEMHSFVMGALGKALRGEKEAKERAIEAEDSATHDKLTGLLNRAGLDAAVEEFMQAGKKPTVISCDLLNFKGINDTLGHTTGDKFLKEVAALLQELLRPGTILARTGGDEFVIVFDTNDNRQFLREDHTPSALTPEERAEAVRKRINSDMDMYLEISKYLREVSPKVHISTGASAAETYKEAFGVADDEMKRHKEELRKIFGSYRTADPAKKMPQA